MIKEINGSFYNGVMFVETPDRVRRDQMSRVLRYVHIDWNNKIREIKESFLRFIEVLRKEAKPISEAIIKSLKNNGIDLDNCRSQCYDNAAVMSGHISGVQKLITDQNLKSIFTNCDNHSLKLYGVDASHEELELATIFAAERLWTFFSRSTCGQIDPTSFLGLTIFLIISFAFCYLFSTVFYNILIVPSYGFKLYPLISVMQPVVLVS